MLSSGAGEGKYHKKEEVIIGKTSKVTFDKVGE
jgi:hypothetical protein